MKKVVIPCLFHDPENATYDKQELGIDVPLEETIERDVFFYRIDCVGPHVDDDNIVIGSVISSGASEYTSLLTKHEIDSLIQKAFGND